MPEVPVNPTVLAWARETFGLSLEEAATKLQIRAAFNLEPPARLLALENGTQAPTRAMLLRMSKMYRRPLIAFYLENPPARGDRGQDFRRLPVDYSVQDEGLVDALLRDIKARQAIVKAALEDEDDANELQFVGSCGIGDGPAAVAEKIATDIQFSLAEFRAQAGTGDAFKYLRSRAEAAGIYVLIVGDLGSHHSQIGVETFRGFAIADSVTPFVVVNHQDAKAAWSFTLLHELVHIWLGQTGISGAVAESQIEMFCNDVAGRLLVHDAEVLGINVSQRDELELKLERIGEFSEQRNISRAMVAYKLFRLDRVDYDTWMEIRGELRRQWFEFRENTRARARGQAGGPNPYVVKRYRAGPALLSTVSRFLGAGAITTVKAAKVLGVKPSRVYEMVRRQA